MQVNLCEEMNLDFKKESVAARYHHHVHATPQGLGASEKWVAIGLDGNLFHLPEVKV